MLEYTHSPDGSARRDGGGSFSLLQGSHLNEPVDTSSRPPPAYVVEIELVNAVGLAKSWKAGLLKAAGTTPYALIRSVPESNTTPATVLACPKHAPRAAHTVACTHTVAGLTTV